MIARAVIARAVIARAVIARAVIARAVIARAVIARAVIARAVIARAVIARAVIARAVIAIYYTHNILLSMVIQLLFAGFVLKSDCLLPSNDIFNSSGSSRGNVLNRAGLHLRSSLITHFDSTGILPQDCRTPEVGKAFICYPLVGHPGPASL